MTDSTTAGCRRRGIGEIGPEAHRWLERLAGMSQRLWQVLPLGPTGYGDSPYQTLSTFAGNPLMISLDDLRHMGLVDDGRLASLPRFPEDHVDFGALIGPRMSLLHEVAAGFTKRATPALRDGLEEFSDSQRPWLDDYTLFASLKAHFGGRAWTEWPTDAARRDAATLAAARRTLAEPIDHARVLQFLFHDQWTRLRRRAHELGIAIIAEDLGVITPDVDQLRDDLGYPGMRILQFAFGDDPRGALFRPESYPANCVVYTGTHDNDTTVGWYRSEPGRDSTRSAEQIAREQHTVRVTLSCDGSEIQWDLIGLALQSPANTAIYPMQDVLGLGSEARMNVPGREGGNWTWRFRWEQLTPEIERRLADATVASGRSP